MCLFPNNAPLNLNLVSVPFDLPLRLRWRRGTQYIFPAPLRFTMDSNSVVHFLKNAPFNWNPFLINWFKRIIRYIGCHINMNMPHVSVLIWFVFPIQWCMFYKMHHSIWIHFKLKLVQANNSIFDMQVSVLCPDLIWFVWMKQRSRLFKINLPEEKKDCVCKFNFSGARKCTTEFEKLPTQSWSALVMVRAVWCTRTRYYL